MPYKSYRNKRQGVTILNNNEKSRKQLKWTCQKQRDAYLELT
jgi:hypothetical protein